MGGQVCERLMGGNQLIDGQPLRQPGYGQTSHVQSGLQPCFECNGKGFSHDSDMAHDREANERCVCCEACKGCGGSGVIQVATTSVRARHSLTLLASGCDLASRAVIFNYPEWFCGL